MSFTGTWIITEMEMWDAEYINMEVQAYIRIGVDGLGDFQFGLVSGEIDGEVVKLGNVERFEFTWEGQDEMDPVSGSGWLKSTGQNRGEGRIKIHLGDSSAFKAVREKAD
jgi:uncharacterized protein YndB with AHSA1/START domain